MTSVTLRSFVGLHATRLGGLSGNPARLLRQLIGFRWGRSETQLIGEPDVVLGGDLVAQLEQDLAELDRGRPLAHLFGSVPFLDWTFRCDSRALIPRPETEALVDRVRRDRQAQPPRRILDLCCGSGVMGLALALSFPEAEVHLTDLCPKALSLCAENVAALSLSDRAQLFAGDLWAAVPEGETYDLVVANPPYVAADDVVEASVLNYEPHLALFSEEGGLEHLLRILAGLDERLGPGGTAAFEFGHAQTQRLGQCLATMGLRGSFTFGEDLFGVSRYLFYSEGAANRQALDVLEELHG